MSNKLMVAFALLAFVAVTGESADNPKWIGVKKIYTTKSSYKVGGDNVRFGHGMAESCAVADLKAVAIGVKNRTTTERWDDLWYGVRVAPGECLVFAWYDLDRGSYGYAAVQNNPNSWSVRSNSAGWVTLSNGNQKKYSYKINGQTVDLDIFNPNNGSDGLTANDILFSYGF